MRIDGQRKKLYIFNKFLLEQNHKCEEQTYVNWSSPSSQMLMGSIWFI